VDIASEVNKQAKDIRFELAGEGPEHARLFKQIRKYGLQDVFFLKGFVGGMSEFYIGLDLYINTSLHEGSPMSVLEAMSMGFLSSAERGGIAEMVKDGLHGFLVERRDPKRFAEKCLAIYRDRDLGRAWESHREKGSSRSIRSNRWRSDIRIVFEGPEHP
jgi:glycosyltransferase involved in cell wall biosynthesis